MFVASISECGRRQQGRGAERRRDDGATAGRRRVALLLWRRHRDDRQPLRPVRLTLCPRLAPRARLALGREAANYGFMIREEINMLDLKSKNDRYSC